MLTENDRKMLIDIMDSKINPLRDDVEKLSNKVEEKMGCIPLIQKDIDDLKAAPVKVRKAIGWTAGVVASISAIAWYFYDLFVRGILKK